MMITQSEVGCVGASKKEIITDSPTNGQKIRHVWSMFLRLLGILDPYIQIKGKAPPPYYKCLGPPSKPSNESDKVYNMINYDIGYSPWKLCAYDSRIDYKIAGGGNVTINDWSNPNPEYDPKTIKNYTNRFVNWKNSMVPWPVTASRWHNSALVPPMLTYRREGHVHWQPDIWRAVAATSSIHSTRPNRTKLYYIQACLPPPYAFMYTNDSNKLQIYPNYTGGPTIVICDQCILSTCITSSFNVQAFVILKRLTYLMTPVNITGIWYDNYGLLVLQQVKELLRPRRLIGLLILGIAALIASIASVTVAAVSLSQQVHTAQHVNDLSKNVSLTLATQETIDRKLEAKVDALEEAVLHIGTELQALRVQCVS